MPIVEDKGFADVRDFNLKFNQLVSPAPTHLTKRKLAERATFMLEELVEFAIGAGLRLKINTETASVRFEPDPDLDQDMAQQADALIDLVYVAKGTAVMMGLPWLQLWDDVQRANMAKVLGKTHRSEVNPGQFLMDVSKPMDWVPPKTDLILLMAGYNRDAYVKYNLISDELCRDDQVYSGK